MTANYIRGNSRLYQLSPRELADFGDKTAYRERGEDLNSNFDTRGFFLVFIILFVLTFSNILNSRRNKLYSQIPIIETNKAHKR